MFIGAYTPNYFIITHMDSSGTVAPSACPLLAAESVHLERGGKTVLSEVSFAVFAGEMTQIVGANGAGKTSLINILCGLLRPDRGRVLWRQQPLDDSEDYRDDVAFVGHKDGVKGDLTPLENLRIAAALGASAAVSPEAAAAQWGVEKITAPCRLLSAGQRRRTALARLLLTRAVLWLVDEPLTALDTDGRQTLGRLLMAHLHRGGAAVMTTHQSPDWPNKPRVISLAVL